MKNKDTKNKRQRRTNAQMWAEEELKIPKGFCENCTSCINHRCRRHNRGVEYGYNRCILFEPKIINIKPAKVIIMEVEGKHVS